MIESKSLHAARLLVFALATTALAFAPGCAKKESPEAQFTQAQHYLEKGDRKSAVIQLKNALQQKPDYAEARYLLGTVYNTTGEVKLAERELRRALDLKMDRVKVAPALAHSLFMQGEFQKVLDETRLEGDAKIESTPEVLSVRGHAQLGLGLMDDAKNSFEQALTKQPEFADALLGQARLAGLDGKLETSVGLVERAIASDPKNVQAWLMKGDVQRLIPNNGAAIAAYQKALELAPDDAMARLSLIAMQISDTRYDEAEKNIEILRKSAPNNPLVNYFKALLEYRKTHYAAARDAIQQVLKVAPAHLPSVLLGGATEYALGSFEQAEQYLNTVLDKAPDNLHARKLMAATLIKTRQFQRAIQLLEATLGKLPDDGQLLMLAGEAYLESNDFAKATEYFGRASKLDPKSAGTRVSLGLSRLAAGETEQAMTDLQSAVELDSGKFQADILLIMTHIQRNELDQALSAIQGLEKKQPDNPLTYNLRGAVYIGKKDVVGVRREFEHALKLQPGYFPAAMNLAQLDLQDKKPDEARKRFETLLEKDKNNMQAMLALANLAVRTGGKREEVLGWLERAKKASPGAPQPLLMLAKYYLQSGDVKQALANAEDAKNTNPDNLEALDILGLTQLAAGEQDHALSTYGKLVALQPKSPLAQFRLASAQIAAGNQVAAGLTLKKVLELKPDYLDARVTLAGLELRVGHNDEALKIAQQVQSQAAQLPAGYVLEGDIRMAEKKFTEAAALYEKAYGLGKNGVLAMKIHAAQTQAGKPEEGEARVKQWLKENPEDLTVRFYLADAYLKGAKYPAAIEEYDGLLKKQPDNHVALNNLAWAYQQVKDPRALEYAEKAYQLKPDNAAVADTLGWMLVEQGKTERGLGLLERAVSLAPDAQEIRYHLAQAWLKAGERVKARDELERILSGGTKFPQEQEAIQLLKELKN